MPFDPSRLSAFQNREAAVFAQRRPLQAARATAGSSFFGGVPQHWMLDWPTPFPLVIARASGTQIEDLDGFALTDLCLGDTGAMFGHAPPALAQALAERGQAGLTTMLPSADAQEVGEGLRQVFGLAWWQLALSASDANRFALRVARAVTGRPRILVFDGCYHGAVDETAVELGPDGQMRPKPSLWGQALDVHATTRCVPFNDLDAARAALAHGDVACVITEPFLTNCGIVPPRQGFLEGLQAACRDTGTLLLMDETHTISTGLGGYTHAAGLEPDLFVAGKAVAGGVPCGIWGFTDAVKAGIDRVRATLPGGHSGVGTTLAGSALQLAALKASLSSLLTQETYAGMLASAAALEARIVGLIRRLGLPWHVTRIGARLEVVFSAQPVWTAHDMRATFDHELEAAIHLGLVNRGFLVTPFHNMLLAGPGLAADAPLRYSAALADVLEALIGPLSSPAQPPVTHAV